MSQLQIDASFVRNSESRTSAHCSTLSLLNKGSLVLTMAQGIYHKGYIHIYVYMRIYIYIGMIKSLNVLSCDRYRKTIKSVNYIC